MVALFSVMCLLLLGVAGGRVSWAAPGLASGRDEHPGAPPPFIFRFPRSAFRTCMDYCRVGDFDFDPSKGKYLLDINSGRDPPFRGGRLDGGGH